MMTSLLTFTTLVAVAADDAVEATQITPGSSYRPSLFLVLLILLPAILYTSPQLRTKLTTTLGVAGVYVWYYGRMMFANNKETKERRTRVRESPSPGKMKRKQAGMTPETHTFFGKGGTPRT